MLSWIWGLVDRACAVAGAFAFSQLPLFMQQYSQRLAGHVAELQIHLDKVRYMAEQSDKSVPQYIAKFLASSDQDFAKQGEFMQGLITRYDALSTGYTAMQQATVFDRPFVFLSHLQWDIAAKALDSFHAGLAFTLEGAVYALLGMAAGMFVFKSVNYLFYSLWQLINRFLPVRTNTRPA